MAELDEASVDSRYLSCGPLFHIATLVMMLATFAAHGTNVFVPRVRAEEICRVVERERCTGAYVLGPTAQEIAVLNHDGRFDLSSLRVNTGNAAFDAMTASRPSRWSARPGGYGQTECGGLLTYRPIGPPAVGTHGRPGPRVALRIVDPDGHDVPSGAVGEIVARAPGVMLGYWNRPELDRARRAGGWHHTTDLGRIEPDGSLTFVGSMTRLIKSASENVYPAEVEACIATHPAVADVAVIGVPDDRWEQSVRAVVVAAPGAHLTEADVIEHCRARIASYKKPRSVRFVDEIPRLGKVVDYERLDAEHGGGAYPGS
jgi:long-chain acyl-CoA synthetase